MGRGTLKRQMRKACPTCNGTGHTAGVFLNACAGCLGTGSHQIRCAQCWKWQPVEEFVSKSDKIRRRCASCTDKYRGWDKKSLEERASATKPRASIRSDGPLRVTFVVESGNRKTGPIPVSMTSARTCPTTCAWFGAGCYAEQHMVSIHWRRVSDGAGLEWNEFVDRVAALPEGQLWRHNEAGDLPGDGGSIDLIKLGTLVAANAGKRGFTYTHKPLTPLNIEAIRIAVREGFAVNVSADTLAEADAARALGLPTVVVLPHDAPRHLKTPAGHTVVVCPAEYNEGSTCESCKLCSVSWRRSVVGFRAHGDRRNQITQRLRQLPLLA